jgi:hypothetical protein
LVESGNGEEKLSARARAGDRAFRARAKRARARAGERAFRARARLTSLCALYSPPLPSQAPLFLGSSG